MDGMGLQVAKYRLLFEAQVAAELPWNKCNLLRGAFGNQVKAWLPDSVYKTVFLGEHSLVGVGRTPGFVIECDDAREHFESGDTFYADFTLFGRQTPWYVLALAWRAMGFYGLGKKTQRFSLRNILAIDPYEGIEPAQVFEGDVESVADDMVSRIWLSEEDHGLYVGSDNIMEVAQVAGIGMGVVTIEFVTPCRIKEDGDLVTEPGLDTLFLSMANRALALNAVWGGDGIMPEFVQVAMPLIQQLAVGVPAIGVLESNLRWQDWQRTSHSQKSEMKLGGFVGGMALVVPAIEQIAPLLAISDIAHVGKATTFGNGRIRVSVSTDTEFE